MAMTVARLHKILGEKIAKGEGRRENQERRCPWWMRRRKLRYSRQLLNLLSILCLKGPTVKIRPMVAWYDCWIGAFWDAAKRRLYIFPVPCVGVRIDFK